MSPTVNRQLRLVRRPTGMVQDSDFEMHREPVPTPGPGEVLVRNLFLSLDPAMRAWLWGRQTYIAPVNVGEVMRCSGVAQVVSSNNPDFAPGDFVVGVFGWQDFCLTTGEGPMRMMKIPPGTPLTWPLGVLGVTGMTAYWGLLDVGQPQPGQTVVVSGAAGAVGSVVGQIARLKGCRSVGLAGGADKCRWVTETGRFDACIDYRTENVEASLKKHCPAGIDVYFDNVGGTTLEACLNRLALRARVVLCGAISTYNDPEKTIGPRNYLNLLTQRARMEGFVVLDYFSRTREFLAEMTPWVLAGEIRFAEDIQQGLENAPATLRRLFEGKNLGKQLLQIAEPQA